MTRCPIWLLLPLLAPSSTALAAELVTLTPETWEAFVPLGKEVDAIYGDLVLKNDRVVAVIGQPVESRNANMTVRFVGGSVIDFTRSVEPNDQLAAFYPGGGSYVLRQPQAAADASELRDVGEAERLSGRTVRLAVSAEAQAGRPAARVEYSLTDGQPWLVVRTTYSNPTKAPLEFELQDTLRTDGPFQRQVDAPLNLIWSYDKWYDQGYGLVPVGRAPVSVAPPEGRRPTLVSYQADGSSKITLPPRGTLEFERRLLVGRDIVELEAQARELAGTEQARFEIVAGDGKPVAGAEVAVLRGGQPFVVGRTNSEGNFTGRLPAGEYALTVTALGRPPVEKTVRVPADQPVAFDLEMPGYVAARISDASGGPIPCKVQFRGRDGTPDPFFFPDTGEHAVHNVYYSHDGRFRQELPPGRYDVIVSHGPEYDAVFEQLEVFRGQEAIFQATLVRSVDTTGWVSSDFHSHASPSGDNTSSQFGRVLNLLCEHVEFCPCTEHNRVSTYIPHLEKLGVRHLMATCSGIELTGSPLPVNHQNAFPLIHKPRTQDGGGPRTDINPVVQIERLAMWDDRSDKLVQQNHPNIVQILTDRDLDSKPDEGFARAFGFMDVIEVHPPDWIFKGPMIELGGRNQTPNTIFNWLQTLNLGYGVPGVVNTDAHYNFHGSGFLRNYLRSETDDPARVQTLDMVHAAEKGRIVMTSGPFLEVTFAAAEPGERSSGGIGDEVRATGGCGTLRVRVQCPNWFDVDRVQVFANGRPDPKLNFTRRTTPGRFGPSLGQGGVKFEQELPIELPADAHLIVAAAAEQSTLGPVMGPDHEKDMPIAVSNPLFVDVDGQGFRPNGDLLDSPLPVQDPPSR
jgi:hypothetical protein